MGGFLSVKNGFVFSEKLIALGECGDVTTERFAYFHTREPIAAGGVIVQLCGNFQSFFKMLSFGFEVVAAAFEGAKSIAFLPAFAIRVVLSFVAVRVAPARHLDEGHPVVLVRELIIVYLLVVLSCYFSCDIIFKFEFSL